MVIKSLNICEEFWMKPHEDSQGLDTFKWPSTEHSLVQFEV